MPLGLLVAVLQHLGRDLVGVLLVAARRVPVVHGPRRQLHALAGLQLVVGIDHLEDVVHDLGIGCANRLERQRAVALGLVGIALLLVEQVGHVLRRPGQGVGVLVGELRRRLARALAGGRRIDRALLGALPLLGVHPALVVDQRHVAWIGAVQGGIVGCRARLVAQRHAALRTAGTAAAAASAGLPA